MANFSFYFYLLASLFLAALTGATTVPGTVYRADTRKPDDIKAAGGFKSFGTLEAITIIEHVKKLYVKPHRQGQDPWISTSVSPEIGKCGTVDKPCWVYTIDTSGIASSFTDVAAAFAAAGETNGHASEEEWAAKLEIPLSHITSFYRLADADGNKRSVDYTWESWAARPTKDSKTSGTKKTSRDDIPLLKKAGTPGAAAAIGA